MRHMSHHSRTMLLLVVAGAALAVVTSGFAGAWACSPASYFVPRDITITSSEPGQVRADLHLVALYTNPDDGDRLVITLEDQQTEMMVPKVAPAGRPDGESADRSVLVSTERFTLDRPGTYYFWTFVRNARGERVDGSLLGASVVVDPPKEKEDPLLLPTSTIAPTTTGSPTIQPATLPATPVRQPDGLPDRRANDAQRPARSVASPSEAPRIATAPAVAHSPSGVPLDIRPSPASAVGLDLPLTPEVADLWSGMDAVDRVPSLLDAAVPVDRGTSPVGAGLLGIGLLVLGGVGAVAGERRLARGRRAGS